MRYRLFFLGCFSFHFSFILFFISQFRFSSIFVFLTTIYAFWFLVFGFLSINCHMFASTFHIALGINFDSFNVTISTLLLNMWVILHIFSMFSRLSNVNENIGVVLFLSITFCCY